MDSFSLQYKVSDTGRMAIWALHTCEGLLVCVALFHIGGHFNSTTVVMHFVHNVAVKEQRRTVLHGQTGIGHMLYCLRGRGIISRIDNYFLLQYGGID